ncbi:MAG: hypothetical protein KA754_01025 [Corallincola sp.]|nr:hypothetical protein [Corallincola sp.]
MLRLFLPLLLLAALPAGANSAPSPSAPLPADEAVHQLAIRSPRDLLELLSPQGLGPLQLSQLAHDLHSGLAYSHAANYPQVSIRLELAQQPQVEAVIDLLASSPFGFSSDQLAAQMASQGLVPSGGDDSQLQYFWRAEGFDCLLELNLISSPQRLVYLCQSMAGSGF